MAVHEITIRRSSAGSELTDHAEHCGVDARLLAELGRTDHPQVRIRRDDDVALYTASTVVHEDRPDIVRMGRAGRRRVDGPDTFDGVLDPDVTRSELTDSVAAARGEFVERLDDDGHQRALIALAPHGGDIERHTDDQAEFVAAELGRSAWRCKGWRPGGGAHERWHITSVDIDTASFPLLHTLTNRRFHHAVAFHGFVGTGVVIGGRAATALKEAIRDAIHEALCGSGVDVRLATTDDRLDGDEPANIVNRLTVRRAGGIQIEQDDNVRRHHWTAIAEAVSEVYANLLSRRR